MCSLTELYIKYVRNTAGYDMIAINKNWLLFNVNKVKLNTILYLKMKIEQIYNQCQYKLIVNFIIMVDIQQY